MTVPVKTMFLHTAQLAAVGVTVNYTEVAVIVPLNGPVPASGAWKARVPAIFPPTSVTPLRVIVPDAAAVILRAVPV